MPSKSPQQHRFMEAAGTIRNLQKKAGIPQSVAKEFVAADEKAAKKKTSKDRKSTRQKT